MIRKLVDHEYGTEIIIYVETQGNDEIGECRFEAAMDIDEITDDEMKRVVGRSRNGKASGYDILANEIYKTGLKIIICRLTE